MKSRTPLFVAALALAALPALASDDCDAPVERWQSREAVQQMAASQGWTVQRLKIDDGCYELRATDAQGRSIKAKVDPETLQIIKIKRRERRRDQRRDHEERGDTGAQAPAASPTSTADAPAVAPIFTPGAAPRARIE
ncbi:MAG: PepSY domain-containing protein [Comamonas sp.]|nr:PepSY domain-containing protein [Comamonas sp.]